MADAVSGVAADDADSEVARGNRFAFGENWARFLASLNDERIGVAEESLRTMLPGGVAGRSVIDAGCGSGLFSLAAKRLGAARVHSFDYDKASVACAEELRRRYFPADESWTTEQGSVLDIAYIERLGTWDVVYSWGVLHHTGAMWQALEAAGRLVAPGGTLFIAIYNDQGWASRAWTLVKRAYNRLPPALRWIVLWPAFVVLWGPRTFIDLLRGRPFAKWRSYAKDRGMNPWRDVVDWVGGYPFEVARPEEIFDFYTSRGFVLSRLKTCGGRLGCNEYVFERSRS